MSDRNKLDKELDRLLKKKAKPDLRKFMGKVRFLDVDPVQFQKKLRDEWD